MLANFSLANLTAYVAIVNPALTSHVLNNIKICFLKAHRADADLLAYVADASEIFCTVIKNQMHCRASLGKLTVLFCFRSNMKSTCAVSHLNWYQGIS